MANGKIRRPPYSPDFSGYLPDFAGYSPWFCWSFPWFRWLLPLISLAIPPVSLAIPHYFAGYSLWFRRLFVRKTIEKWVLPSKVKAEIIFVCTGGCSDFAINCDVKNQSLKMYVFIQNTFILAPECNKMHSQRFNIIKFSGRYQVLQTRLKL